MWVSGRKLSVVGRSAPEASISVPVSAIAGEGAGVSDDLVAAVGCGPRVMLQQRPRRPGQVRRARDRAPSASSAGRFCARQIVGDRAPAPSSRSATRVDRGRRLLAPSRRTARRAAPSSDAGRAPAPGPRGVLGEARLELGAAASAGGSPRRSDAADARRGSGARVAHRRPRLRAPPQRLEGAALRRRQVATRRSSRRRAAGCEAAAPPAEPAQQRAPPMPVSAAIERRPRRDEGPEPQRPRARPAATGAARTRARASAASSSAAGCVIGQTLSQRPQKVEAFGRCPASSTPIRLGVSTAPIGPG